MFERFTESARRSLFFARYEASLLGVRKITAEVLMLGVLREGKGLTGQILRTANVSYGELVRELGAEESHHEKIPTSVEIPFHPATHEILHLAMAEADELGHSHIGTEHLVLGVLRRGETRAAATLGRHGLTFETARAEVVRMSSAIPEDVRGKPHEKLTFEVHQALACLDQIASIVDELKRLPDDQLLVQRLHTAIESDVDFLRRMFLGQF